MNRNYNLVGTTVIAAATILCLSAGPVFAQKAIGMKPAITGLVTMGDISIISNPSKTMAPATIEIEKHPGVYSAVVIVARWSHLEPARGTFDDAEIESAMKGIRGYNAKYPKTPVVAKLRLFGGPNAPDWAKALDGGPIDIGVKGKTMVIAKFWSPVYGQAWRELQAHLAAKYDNDPLMEEVAMSSCTATSAEPFHTGLDSGNIPIYKKAGYTSAKMEACLMGQPDDYAAWKHVALDYTLNRFLKLSDKDTADPDEEFTDRVAENFRKRFGARAVIANHGLEDVEPPRAVDLYVELKKLGPPMAFQTTNWKTSFDLAVQAAKACGATEFEMWNTKDTGAGPDVNYEELKSWTKLFPYTNMLAAQK